MQNLVKAELHLHLEGTLEPKMMLDLAKRNNSKLEYNSINDIKKLYNFTKLQDFLDIYYRGLSVLQTEDDFFDLTLAYLTKAHHDNVSHTEVFFDPQAHLSRGISLSTIFAGISRAIVHAKETFAITTSIIVCFLRDLGETNALKIFEQLMPFRDQFIGIGLDSSEIGYSPRLFRNLFEAARNDGLRLVSHAGEEAPASYIWEAIDVLGVERIDHGNTAITDKTLVKRIAQDKIPLTMCPLSNLALRVVKDLKDHAALKLLNEGVIVTINSDDPAYFSGYINDNYQALATALNLSAHDMQVFADNSLKAKFI